MVADSCAVPRTPRFFGMDSQFLGHITSLPRHPTERQTDGMDMSARTSTKAAPLRRQSRGYWTAQTILLAIALVSSSLFLAGCGRSVVSATCTMKELNAIAGKGYLKLPPTHDNDAGRGRIPDTHPDADLDANQRAALCKIYKSEAHLPG
jgi:hypothetical protein